MKFQAPANPEGRALTQETSDHLKEHENLIIQAKSLNRLVDNLAVKQELGSTPRGTEPDIQLELSGRINQILNENSTLKKLIGVIRDDLAKVSRENRRLKTELEDAGQRTTAVRDLEEQIDELERERSELQSRLKDAQVFADQKDLGVQSLKARLENSERIIKMIRTQISEAERGFKSIADSLKATTMERDRLRVELSCACRANDESRREIETVSAAGAKLETHLKAVVEELIGPAAGAVTEWTGRDIVQEIARLKKRLQGAEAERDEKKQALAQLEEKNRLRHNELLEARHSLEKTLAERERIEAENARLKKSVRDYELLNESNQRTIGSLARENEEAKTELEAAKRALDEQLDGADERHRREQEAGDKIKSLTRENDRIAAELDGANRAREQIRREFANLMDEHRLLIEQMNTLNDACQKIQHPTFGTDDGEKESAPGTREAHAPDVLPAAGSHPPSEDAASGTAPQTGNLSISPDRAACSADRPAEPVQKNVAERIENPPTNGSTGEKTLSSVGTGIFLASPVRPRKAKNVTASFVNIVGIGIFLAVILVTGILYRLYAERGADETNETAVPATFVESAQPSDDLIDARRDAANTAISRADNGVIEFGSRLSQPRVSGIEKAHDALARGDNLAALRHLSEYLALAPSDPNAHELANRILVSASDPSVGEKFWKGAAKTDQRAAAGFLEFARILRERKKTEAAVSAYAEICKLVPENPDALLEFARMLEACGRHDEAYVLLTRGRTAQKFTDEIEEHYIRNAVMSGNFNEIRAQILQSAATGRFDDRQWLDLGEIVLSENEKARFAEWYKVLLSRQEKCELSARLKLQKARCLEAMGREDLLEAELAHIVEIEPSNARAAEWLVNVYIDRREWALAAECLERHIAATGNSDDKKARLDFLRAKAADRTK